MKLRIVSAVAIACICFGLVRCGSQSLRVRESGAGRDRSQSEPISFSLVAPDTFGINAHRPEGEQANQLFEKVRAAGISWVRLDFNWDDLEPQKGNFDWAETDFAVKSARDRGLQVFANLNRSPSWANGGKATKIPATNSADWENFCRQVAIRYDGNHGQPKIDVFGMWNEPDGSGLGDSTDSLDKKANDYVNLVLIPGSRAIRAARSDAKVAGPDLASETTFLTNILGKAKSSLDIVTVHKYSDNASGVTDYTEKIKTIMTSAGIFGSKPLWLTETGWSTPTTKGCWFPTVSDSVQSSKYTELLQRLKDRPWVNKVFFYELMDDDSAGACQWGILRSNMSEKPSYQAYKTFIANSTSTTNNWMEVNSPNINGGDFGHISSGKIGGVFARSSVVRSFVHSNWTRSLRRTETFSMSGQFTLQNVNFDGSFYLGFLDRNDPAIPLSLIGLTFREPSGSATGSFRVQATIQHSRGTKTESAVFALSQNAVHTFSLKWTGRSDGSGTLSGLVDNQSVSVSQGAGDESLNAFGIGVGLDATTLSDRKTGPTFFSNLQFTVP